MKELTLEQRRLERLRNLLGPLYNLPQLIVANEDGNLDELIKETAESAIEVIPYLDKALKENVTMEELNQLYTEPENRR